MASPTPKAIKSKNGFRVNEFVVYPAHGVGQIKFIERREVVGLPLELFGIAFEKEKMILRVPTNKVEAVGMRKVASRERLEAVLKKLNGKARVRRTTWSRRAQEYESKINSGDILLVSEVVRDLFRAEHQAEPSYSERQLFESAMTRIASEFAVVERISEEKAITKITSVLASCPHRMPPKTRTKVESDTKKDVLVEEIEKPANVDLVDSREAA